MEGLRVQHQDTAAVAGVQESAAGAQSGATDRARLRERGDGNGDVGDEGATAATAEEHDGRARHDNPFRQLLR